MLSHKLESNLLFYLKNNIYNMYRVIIEYNHFNDKISKKINNSNGEVLYCLNNINLIAAYVPKTVLIRLTELPEVTHICFDQYCQVCATPVGVLPANKLRFSHNYKLNGEGVSIALIDTGVFPHKELLSPSNRIKYFSDNVQHLHYPYDDNGHGTFISGLLCANGLFSNNMYKSLSSCSNLCVFKAFDGKGKGYASTILASIDEILSLYEDLNIRLICLPAELLQHNPTIEDYFNNLFKQCYLKNIIIVVPSGSAYDDHHLIMGFATSKYCITVGGYDTYKTDKPYEYSSYGVYKNIKKPDFVAAASNITSFNCDTSYVSERKGVKLYPHTLEKLYTCYSGTSCSAAFITSVICLLIQKDPSLSFKDIYSLLKLSSNKDLASTDSIGNGVIDISKIIN